MNYQFSEQINELDNGKKAAYLTVSLGNTEFSMFLSSCGYISVYRRVNGKGHALSRLGRTFHSWDELDGNYKKLREAMPMIKAKALLLTRKAYGKAIIL